MKKIRFLVVATVLSMVLWPSAAPAGMDEYDESQSHPLRVVAYVVHPIGRLLEWAVARPFHAIVSDNPDIEYVFGHRPHPPLFVEPQPAYDVGVPNKVPLRERAPAARVAPREPVAERVTIQIREVPVEKTVIREVTKVVEVERVVFPDIAFEFDSARLTDLGKGKAYLVAQKLREKADVVVVIEGHADYMGSEEYNMRLGLRRAETVMKELAQLEIDPARMSVATFGESKPLIDQQTDWARAVNRRVEFSVKAQ